MAARATRIVAVVLAVVAATACSQGAGPRPEDRLTSSPSPDESGILRVAIPPPASLDPMRISSRSDALVARQLYEGLTRWDPVAEQVLPAAAQSWDVLEGGRLFRFSLRPGMLFHDGSPVTASDFVYAFDRIAQRANSSELAYALEPVIGFAAVNEQGSASHLEGLVAVDDLTLEVQLAGPYHDLPAVLTHPGLVPLPRQAAERYDEFLRAPTGNGPFQMAEAWEGREDLVLTAWPSYFDPPALSGIRFVASEDAAAGWLPMLDGTVDVAEVPAGQVGEAEASFGDDGFAPLLGGYYFGLRLDARTLADRRMRKAINLAIDRGAIAREIFRGNMVAPRGVVPEGMPGFRESLCVALCSYDPEAAAREIARVAPARRVVTIQYTAGEPHGRVARYVARDLERIGIRVVLRAYGFPAYVRLLKDDAQEMHRLGWLAEFPTADAFLTPLFTSTSPDNHSGFASERVDALIARAHAEPGEGRRQQLYIAAEKAVMRAIPLVPIGSYVMHWAAHPWVTGLVVDAMGGFDVAPVAIER